MSIQRREVYQLTRELAGGQVIYVESIKATCNYFF